MEERMEELIILIIQLALTIYKIVMALIRH